MVNFGGALGSAAKEVGGSAIEVGSANERIREAPRVADVAKWPPSPPGATTTAPRGRIETASDSPAALAAALGGA